MSTNFNFTDGKKKDKLFVCRSNLQNQNGLLSKTEIFSSHFYAENVLMFMSCYGKIFFSEIAQKLFQVHEIESHD